MTERILSQLQREYRDFFLQRLSEFDVKSPAELSKEKKSQFFTSIKNDWSKIKASKTLIKENVRTELIESQKEQIDIPNDQLQGRQGKAPQPQTIVRGEQRFSNEIIKSEPNKEQTDDLRILFKPNNHFSQGRNYNYPVVKMPLENSNLSSQIHCCLLF